MGRIWNSDGSLNNPIVGNVGGVQPIHDTLAADGDIITLPSGTFNWGTDPTVKQFTCTKQIQLNGVSMFDGSLQTQITGTGNNGTFVNFTTNSNVLGDGSMPTAMISNIFFNVDNTLITNPHPPPTLINPASRPMVVWKGTARVTFLNSKWQSGFRQTNVRFGCVNPLNVVPYTMGITDCISGLIDHCWWNFDQTLTAQSGGVCDLNMSSSPGFVTVVNAPIPIVDATNFPPGYHAGFGQHQLVTDVGWGSDFTGFIYWEDNIIEHRNIGVDYGGDGTFSGTQMGGGHCCFRHNAAWCWFSCHGLEDSDWGGVAGESYNNVFYAPVHTSFACHNTRSGAFVSFNERRVGGYNALSSQNTFSQFRLSSIGNAIGAVSGTNFWDKNHTMHLVNPATGRAFDPDGGPQPTDPRSGSIYKRASQSLGVQTNSKQTSYKYTLLALDTLAAANDYVGFTLRNTSAAAPDTLGDQFTNVFQITVAPNTTAQGTFYPIGTLNNQTQYQKVGDATTTVQCTAGTPKVWQIYVSGVLTYQSVTPTGPSDPWIVSQWQDMTPANVTVTTIAPAIMSSYIIASSAPNGSGDIQVQLYAPHDGFLGGTTGMGKYDRWELRYVDNITGALGATKLGGHCPNGGTTNPANNPIWGYPAYLDAVGGNYIYYVTPTADGIWSWDNLYSPDTNNITNWNQCLLPLQSSATSLRFLQGGLNNATPNPDGTGVKPGYPYIASPTAAQLRIGPDWDSGSFNPNNVTGVSVNMGPPATQQWGASYPHPFITQAPPNPTMNIVITGNLNFGNVSVGSTAQAVMSIHNTGNTAFSFTNVTSSDTHFTFDVTSGTVNPGSLVNVNVSFTPTGNVTYSSTITVVCQSGVTGTNTTTATGTGTGAGNTVVWNITPSSISFGTLSRNSNVIVSVQIQNTGNSSGSITNLVPSAAGIAALSFTTATINPGATQTLLVTADTSQLGNFSGNIVITGNQTSGPTTIPFSSTIDPRVIYFPFRRT